MIVRATIDESSEILGSSLRIAENAAASLRRKLHVTRSDAFWHLLRRQMALCCPKQGILRCLPALALTVLIAASLTAQTVSPPGLSLARIDAIAGESPIVVLPAVGDTFTSLTSVVTSPPLEFP